MVTSSIDSQTHLTEVNVGNDSPQKNYGSTKEDISSSVGWKHLLSKTECSSTLTQFAACFGKYLCMLNIGLIASLPILIIPLVGNKQFFIDLSTNDIENLVSIIYIVMPIGTMLAVIPFKVKRKPPIILTQAVMVGSWIGTYFARTPWQLLMARAFGGIAMTLSQPHISCYIGEVTTPKLRGIFSNVTQTMGIIGQFIMSGLTFLHNWDVAIFICTAFSFSSMIYLFFIPESPMLLINYGEHEAAFVSLTKLRGGRWANMKEVDKEFKHLIACYSKNSAVSNTGINNYSYEVNNGIKALRLKTNNSSKEHVFTITSSNPDPTARNSENSTENYITTSNSEAKHKVNNDNDDSLIPWYKYILLPKMYKPLFILTVCSFFVVGPTTQALTQYLRYILEDLSISGDYYNNILTMVTSSMLGGNLVSTCIISIIGKKKIVLISTIGAGLSFLSLIMVHTLFEGNGKVWLIGFFLCVAIFLDEFGIRSLYHSLMSELFPMRGKRLGTSIVVLIICLNGVIIGQLFLKFLKSSGAISVFAVDCCLCFFGAVFFYFFYLETEGKTLKEIENDF